jgi:chromosome segregation ATPase
MAEREDSGDDRGVEGDSGIRDRVQDRGSRAASEIAQAVIGSPAFGQAVSAAVAARELAGDAQRAALGALNVSSQEQAERLERRIRVLSERLEEAEDRLDAALATVRALEKRLADSVGDDSSAPDGSGESKD